LKLKIYFVNFIDSSVVGALLYIDYVTKPLTPLESVNDQFHIVENRFLTLKSVL